MSSWKTYPKIYAIGHKAIQALFYEDVLVEEKVDGSQFSFGLFEEVVDGTIEHVLRFRSKNVEFSLENANAMFTEAVASVLAVKDRLHVGWAYRGEFLQKPKHNVLAYDRAPTNGVIIFDINDGEESYLSYDDKAREAETLGFEVVPLLFRGKISSVVDLEKLLERTSVLGGQKIEGFVIKNYARFGMDKKALMGKFVSEAFKEKHKVDWANDNPAAGDVINKLVATYRTSARWDKSIIHLRERGLLEGTPRDISLIIKEVPKDLLAECEDEIKDILWNWARNKVMRGINQGLASYYKEILMKSQVFAPEEVKQ